MESQKQQNESANTPKQFDYKAILPNLPNNLPQEPYDFEPKLPNREFFVPFFSTRALAKKIYNDMLSASRDYARLISVCPKIDKDAVESLKSQMQILSIAMLNIYQNIAKSSKLPTANSAKPQIANDCKKALQLVYDRVYALHKLATKLFVQKLDEQSSAMLLVVISNLKSQLKTLEKLQDGLEK